MSERFEREEYEKSRVCARRVLANKWLTVPPAHPVKVCALGLKTWKIYRHNVCHWLHSMLGSKSSPCYNTTIAWTQRPPVSVNSNLQARGVRCRTQCKGCNWRSLKSGSACQQQQFSRERIVRVSLLQTCELTDVGQSMLLCHCPEKSHFGVKTKRTIKESFRGQENPGTGTGTGHANSDA